jgi:ppGpp synthetase/RelA/SpoT-type nucleotidyltranferase
MRAVDFLETVSDFESRRPMLIKSARLLEELIRLKISPGSFWVSSIEHRVKSSSSFARKILKKNYLNPIDEMTDLVGIRIICVFDEDATAIHEYLARYLEFESEPEKFDAGERLKNAEFGYQSKHLVGTLGRQELQFAELKGLTFELQVRTLLQHAWANLHHEEVYKRDLGQQVGDLRRYAAVAAVAGLLDKEMSNLRSSHRRAINAAKLEMSHLSKSRRGLLPLTTGNLVAVLEAEFVDGLSWYDDVSDSGNFPRQTDSLFSETLSALGVDTVGKFLKLSQRESVRRNLRQWAANSGILESKIPHFQVCLAALHAKNRAVAHTLLGPETKSMENLLY